MAVRIVIAPDKFKGSLTAEGVAEHLARGLAAAAPDAELVRVPVADGGDGTVDAALAAGFAPVTATVTGPLGDPVPATFAVGDGHGLGAPGVRTAVVELATASGLGALPRDAGGRPRRDALRATSRGTGELVAAALDAGVRLVVLGLGGSACTDGGTGMLAALGVRFADADGRALPDGGGALGALDRVDLDGLDPRVPGTRFLLASDVDNPLLGPRGAAAVFAPQKGASPADVAVLETGLARWRDRLAAVRPEAAAAADTPGAGAAGGVGFAALGVLGAEARAGIDLVLGLTNLAGLVDGADLVITGEGSLDEQSLGGKAPVGVARLAARAGVPVVAVCGRNELSAAQAAAAGLAAVHPLTEIEPDVARCIAAPGPILETIGARIAATVGTR
ncbi:glycerate kinase [Friedmanniella endophytica]|uniref:Glycerate kinase n=2 Tax=Microlunatus kandeliicorticis TaxID=1759536 RepID=A0A7W3P6N1_9ACTN|nr:glycerate kinase [Microlunatus kandeliicorticis]